MVRLYKRKNYGYFKRIYQRKRNGKKTYQKFLVLSQRLRRKRRSRRTRPACLDRLKKQIFLYRIGRRNGRIFTARKPRSEIDWLEEIFVEPRHQNKGIGSRAVKLAENLVKEYSESMYTEAAARNASAIKLYRKLGYNCLNTVTLRKDFLPDCFDVVRTVTINGAEFEIKRKK